MVKFSGKRLLSRRQFFTLGISAVTAGTIVGLSKLQALSYLTYPFKDKQGKPVDKKSRKFTYTGKNSLKQRAKAKGLIYGAYPQADPPYFEKDRKLQAHFVRDCAMMTVGTFWVTIRPDRQTFEFSVPDYYVKFATTNKMLLRGHPLVWHESMAQWLPTTLNSENAEQILTEHINTVVRRYAGKMHSWDVVNEAIDLGKKGVNGFRNTPWLKALGTDYIDLAFRLAAKADPKAKLVYNDYGVEYDTPEDDARRAAVLNLLRRMKSAGTPIHALGIQSHLSGEIDSFNADKFRKFIRSVASLGLEIMITELDVTDDKLPLNTAHRDAIIAGAYEDYLGIALAEKSVISVTTWGLSDRYTWISGHNPRVDKAHVRPLPFDRDMKPKLVWNALARSFDRAPNR
jgi:endo-1,4-beta-xylanase